MSSYTRLAWQFSVADEPFEGLVGEGGVEDYQEQTGLFFFLLLFEANDSSQRSWILPEWFPLADIGNDPVHSRHVGPLFSVEKH